MASSSTGQSEATGGTKSTSSGETSSTASAMDDENGGCDFHCVGQSLRRALDELDHPPRAPPAPAQAYHNPGVARNLGPALAACAEQTDATGTPAAFGSGAAGSAPPPALGVVLFTPIPRPAVRKYRDPNEPRGAHHRRQTQLVFRPAHPPPPADDDAAGDQQRRR